MLGVMHLATISLLLLTLNLEFSIAHVALTYPVPRTVNYDFMDNIRTQGPCGGQPKGE